MENRNIFKLLFYFWFWPLSILYNSGKVLKLHGKKLKTQYSISLTKQFMEIIKLGLMHNLHPSSYHKYGLWKNESKVNAHLYIQNKEHMKLLHKLDKRYEGTDKNFLYGKEAFFKACLAVDSLKNATIPIILYCKGGKIKSSLLPEEQLPEEDLFVKFTNLKGGIGADRFIYEKVLRKFCNDSGSYSQIELIDHLKKLSLTNPVIVQPRLRNHPEIEDKFTNGSLSTMRVVTYKINSKKADFLLASYRMPTGNGKVDNMSSGGIAAKVDSNGRLGYAYQSSSHMNGPYTHHPDSGYPIKGSYLPYYLEMINLAKTAHSELTDLYILGWDVAMSDHGPMLIEPNIFWGQGQMQVPHESPLGLTDFPKIYLEAMGYGLS